MCRESHIQEKNQYYSFSSLDVFLFSLLTLYQKLRHVMFTKIMLSDPSHFLCWHLTAELHIC